MKPGKFVSFGGTLTRRASKRSEESVGEMGSAFGNWLL